MDNIGFDYYQVRSEFPVLSQTFNGKPLVYLDNGATTQKSKAVIERVHQFDHDEYATIHRGAYTLGEKASQFYEDTRKKVASFIAAQSHKEIIFTSGTTQSINLVAHSFGKQFIREGDEVLVSNMEHHANIVPWQVLCDEKKAILKVIPINDDGEIIMEEYDKLLTVRTKIVAITHVSNVLGTINPIKLMAQKAHKVGAKILVDGAQSTPHMKIDVQELECDFFVLSGHKMYAPTGIGVLYGRYELLEQMPPYVTGGDMINKVTFEKSSYAKPPSRFEAGTPPISQVIGLGAAIDYLLKIGLDKIEKYEQSLLVYGTGLLSEINGLKIIGTATNKAAILSFTLKDIHPHDIVTLLNQDSICCRGGHHCAQPTMIRFGVPATTRASMSFYNNKSDLDALAKGIQKVIEVFA